jgi:hypothetical protein
VFFRWLDAVRKEFATLVTGSLLLALMGLAQGVWQVPIPRWSYLAVTGCFLTWAFYRTWLKQHSALQSANVAEEAKMAALVAGHEETIKQKDDVIRALSEKPPRSAAEQHDYDAAKKALQPLKEKGVIAVRHIRSHGSLTFGIYNPVLPPGLNLDDTLWVYRHCASEGVLTCKSNTLNTEQTFAVVPKMEKVLDELLFEEQASRG